MDLSKLPVSIIALSLALIAGAFLYIVIAKPSYFEFAGLGFGAKYETETFDTNARTSRLSITRIQSGVKTTLNDGKHHQGEPSYCPAGQKLVNFGLVNVQARTTGSHHYCRCTKVGQSGVVAEYNANDKPKPEDNNPNGYCACFGLCVSN